MLDVLILEDDDASREALAAWFGSKGLDCRAAPDLATARSLIEERRPDFAVLDLELPDGSGLELLAELSPGRHTDVLMVSGRGTLDAAIDALRHGARDFLTKPVDLDRLEAIVRSTIQTAELRAQMAELRGELRRFGRFGDLLGSSPVMQSVYDLLEKVAPTDETVLLTGATGTGKEVTAATLHKLSARASEPFVAINCGAIATNLVESELFGHERGAFTGADKRHAGVFERASGGTLFLDEITEMDAELQVRLLRVLEMGQVTRVGGTRPLDVDVRLIAATNRDPHQAVADGQLREDLLYRLMVFPVALPPLAERGEDVLLLARRELELLNEEAGTGKELTPAASRTLLAHDWPGNVRELRNAMRRAHLLADDHIEPSHLTGIDVAELADAQPSEPADGHGHGHGEGGGPLSFAPDEAVATVEKRLIQAAMEHFDGNKTRCAESLGISLKTLYARLKVYAAEDGSA